MTTRVDNGYPLPDEIRSGSDLGRFLNARYLSDHMQLVSTSFLDRRFAVEVLAAAFHKLHWWADNDELLAAVTPWPDALSPT